MLSSKGGMQGRDAPPYDGAIPHRCLPRVTHEWGTETTHAWVTRGTHEWVARGGSPWRAKTLHEIMLWDD